MPLFGHQRSSRRPTVTSGDIPDDPFGREIRVEQPGISSGFRLRDILSDLVWPAPQTISGMLTGAGLQDELMEDRKRHERRLRLGWGETPTEEEINAALEIEALENAGEFSPSLPRLLSVYSGHRAPFSPLGPFTGLLKRLGPAALLGGALIEPALKDLGARIGRPEGGSILTPGGPEGQTKWDSVEDILRADEEAMRRERERIEGRRVRR